jgi:hypothetical protein
VTSAGLFAVRAHRTLSPATRRRTSRRMGRRFGSIVGLGRGRLEQRDPGLGKGRTAWGAAHSRVAAKNGKKESASSGRNARGLRCGADGWNPVAARRLTRRMGMRIV